VAAWMPLAILQELCERGDEFVDSSAHVSFGNNHSQTQGNISHSNFTSEGGTYDASVYREISFATIWINMQINIVLCIVQLLLFWICLRWKPHIFAPRLDPAQVPKCPCGWILKVWEETKMGRGKSARHIARRLNNLDGAIMVRFCVLGFKISMFGSLLAGFLLPWYYRAGGGDGSGHKPDQFTEFNLANLQGKECVDKFWPAVLCAYLLTLSFVHLGMDEWCNFDIMRKEHLTRLACGAADAERPGAAQAIRSILIELVPPNFRDVTGDSIKRFFAKLFPHVPPGIADEEDGVHNLVDGGVHSAVVQPETGEIYGKVDAVVLGGGRKRLRDLRNAMAPAVSRARKERQILKKQLTEEAEELGSRASAEATALTPARRPSTQSGFDDLVPSPRRRTSIDTDHSQDPWACQPSQPLAGPTSGKAEENGSTWHEVAESTEYVAQAAIDHTRLAAEAMLQRVQQAASLFQEMVLAKEGGLHIGSSTAFVTFYSLADRVAAEQLVLVQSDMQALTRQGWLIRAAPEAADIIWANAAVPHAQRWFRTLLVRCLLVLAMIFWIVPITLIQVWTRIDNWHIPWISSLQDDQYGQVIYTLLASYLPVLSQMGLMYTLPVLLEWLGQRMEGEKVKSRVQIVVVGRYLRFLMVTIYCTIIGGSLLQSICAILRDPYNIFDLFAREVPQVATYFISYVMARAGLSAPMLLLFALLSACEKDDEKRIIVRPNYAMEASNLVLILVLGMTYAIIAPMIMFACAVYFALTALIYSWLFLYVYTPEYDCKGQMWSQMFNGSLFGLLVGATSLAGIASAFVGPTSGSFVASLALCVIILVLFPFFRITYAEPAQYIPLEVAREVDVACSGKISVFFDTGYYFDPIIEGLKEKMLEADARISGGGCCSCCARRRKDKKALERVSSLSEDDDDDGEISSDTEVTEDTGASSSVVTESDEELAVCGRLTGRSRREGRNDDDVPPPDGSTR